MKELPLLGRVYTVSDSREKYIYYLNKYRKLAENYSEDFEDEYIGQFHDMDSVINNVLEYGNAVIREVIEKECIAELVANGFYSYNFERFFDEYYGKKYYVYEDHYNVVADKYTQIIFTQEQQHQYRELRKETRGRWVGGGFGVKGAVKGAAKAGAMNMATGAAHGIFNAIGNYMTDSETNRKKKALFCDSETKSILVAGIYDSIFNLAYALMDFFNQNTEIRIEGVSDEQKKEADIILDNLSKFPVSDEIKTDLIYKILYLNPFNKSAYMFILNDIGDERLELENLAKVFGIDLKSEKRNTLESIFQSINLEDRQKLAEGRKQLEEKAEKIGADASPYVAQTEASLKILLQKEEIKKQAAKVKRSVLEQFQIVAPIKERIDAVCNSDIDAENNVNVITDILDEVNGEIAYAEWAAFDIFNGLVIKCIDDTRAGRYPFENGLDAIEELLKIYDKGLNSCMEAGSSNVQKNVALNVIRAAVHSVAIRGVHSIYEIDSNKSGMVNDERYERRRKIYKEQQEQEDLLFLKKCAEIIFEGAEQENALACILQLHFFGSSVWTEKEKKLCKIAAEKYYPDAACQLAAMLLGETKSIKETMEGAYWLMMADKLGVRLGIDLNEDALIEMCMPYAKSEQQMKPLEKKQWDKKYLIMYVDRYLEWSEREISVGGIIRTGKVSAHTDVTLLDANGNYKGNSRVMEIIGRESSGDAYMGEDVDFLLDGSSANLGVEEGDVLYFSEGNTVNDEEKMPANLYSPINMQKRATMDKQKRIMNIEDVFPEHDQGIIIAVGTIQCGKVSRGSDVTLFDSNGNYKGESWILGIEKNANLEETVSMGDSVDIIMEDKLKVQTGDILCLS